MNRHINFPNKILVSAIFAAALITSSSIHGRAFGDSSAVNRSNEIGVSLIDSNPADRSNDVNKPMAQIILPACTSATATSCLEAVAIYKNGSSKTLASPLGQAAGAIAPSKLHRSLPTAGEAHLFKAASGSGLSDSQEYSVKIVENFLYSDQNKMYEHLSFSIFVQPFVREQGPVFNSNSQYDVSQFAWWGDGEAGKITKFEKDVRVAVTVRVPKNDGGWFSGRVADPLVQFKSEPAFNVLTVDALPVVVPRVQAWVAPDKKTSLMSKLGMSVGVNHAIESGFDDSVNWVDQLKPYVQDKSSSEETAWVVRSTYIQNPCFPKSRVSGFVTTNAMAYSWNPPVLKDGFLDYQVAGMHKTSAGDLTRGSYDLVLNSETARCLYKFSSAPISATISILGESTESRTVATTVLSEKDGFLKLSANDFTFSNPTIRVQLLQATPASQPTIAPKRTITCMKGKTVKKVAGIAPKCPSGYRIK